MIGELFEVVEFVVVVVAGLGGVEVFEFDWKVYFVFFVGEGVGGVVDCG